MLACSPTNLPLPSLKEGLPQLGLLLSDGKMGKEIKLGLVVVAVTQVTTHGVHNVADLDIRLETEGGKGVVEGEGLLGLGSGGPSVDLVETVLDVVVLPQAPVVVDKAVVEEERRVTRGGSNVGHDGTDRVVAVGVGTAGGN